MWNRPVRCLSGAAVAALLAGPILAAPAGAAVPHVVQPGETLWSIAAASNFTTRTVAAHNGLPETASVVPGQTLMIPTVEEGAAALASAGIVPGEPSVTSEPAPAASGSRGGHVVAAGETLSGIAAAYGVSVSAIGEANGRSTDSFAIEGETLTIPAAGGSPAPAPAETRPASEPAAAEASPTAGYGHIETSSGQLQLAPGAAESWEAMRQESLRLYGQDLQPVGPISAHRTYAEQDGLYRAFLNGQGAPANPPGTSAHEVGLAVDLATPEMRWVVDQIGWQFGWGKVEAPGEWWHVNYVGG